MKNIDEINDLLKGAQNEYAEVRIQDAINTLYRADKYISSINTHDKMSVRNKTQDKNELKLIYYSKFGNIYYAIEDYNNALICYNRVQKEIPSNCKVYKAIGDCYRKLGEYDLAIENYEKALIKYKHDSSASKHDKASILNNKALVYMDMESSNYELSIELFKDAIKIDANNPLYYCNLGRALHADGKKKEGLKQFQIAKELVENNQFGSDLDKNNKSYIKNTLADFIETMDNLNKIELRKQDTIIEKREKGLANKFLEALQERVLQKKEHANLQEAKEHLLTTKQKLSQLELDGNEKLYRYYDGFIFNMIQAYVTAISISSGKFTVDTSSMTVDAVEKLISLIPFVGDIIGGSIKKTVDFIRGHEIKTKAINVSKFARTIDQFEELSQDAVVSIVLNKKDDLNEIEPEKYNLKSWSDKFRELILNIDDEIDKKLYGERNETPMQRLGHKDSCKLIQEIASGEFYSSRKAIELKTSDKIAKLEKSTNAIIEEEIKDQHKQYEKYVQKYNNLENENQNDDSNNKQNGKDEKTPGCCPPKCEIFNMQLADYDNPILNNNELFHRLVEKFGITAVMNGTSEQIHNGNIELVRGLAMTNNNDLELWENILGHSHLE